MAHHQAFWIFLVSKGVGSDSLGLGCNYGGFGVLSTARIGECISCFEVCGLEKVLIDHILGRTFCCFGETGGTVEGY
jgi:hypothetical protein